MKNKKITINIMIKELGYSVLKAFGIFFFSLLVAFGFNHVYSNGIPLIRKTPFEVSTDCPEVLGELPEITLDKLPRGSQKVVYMDARMADEFVRGHIQGAFFMPMYPVDNPNLKPLKKLEKGTWIIVYGSKKVQNAQRLISLLMNEQIRGVHILKGGFKVWKDSGRKVEKHPLEYKDLNWIKENFADILFVDIREPDSRENKISESINFPHDKLLAPEKKVLTALKNTSKKHLIVVTENGDESENIKKLQWNAAELNARGFDNVYIYRGDLKNIIELENK
ncbi:MAG: rhodanese-like domain-containing protein [Deltaproteobacteria bacterium]|jgi:rhodanese-related sulfurtransferase|nr:rhodanese-like domain-containing protein [Deltaproteobacteria bacterium]